MDNNPELINKNLKIVFWNTRSFIQRRLEIETMLQRVDIFICVESWLTPKNSIRFPGFVTVRRDRVNTRGGGILMLIRKNLAFVTINNLMSPDNSVELCGVHINNVSPPLDIITCYRAPGLTLTQTKWHEILDNVNNRDHCLMMGDFNAHNVIWNCRDTDTNGDRLYNSIDSHNLLIQNFDSATHIDIHRNLTSNLDLVLSTPLISDKIRVQVSDETLGSDHFPIFLNIDSKKYFYEKKHSN